MFSELFDNKIMIINTLKELILAERKFDGFGGFGQNPPNQVLVKFNFFYHPPN